jgi:RNA polymerase sigma factor (sigma-70 family)
MSCSISSSHVRPQPPARKPHTFRELFTRHKRDLLDYLTRRVGRTDAPDLLQETFVRFLQHEQEEAVANPPPFLQKIAVNLARDFARRRKTEAKYLEFGDLPENAPSGEALPDARLEVAEQWRLVCAAIVALPPRCREVFILYMRDGLTLAEIAGRLGVSRNMAQKHMRLALERCWAALE